MTKCHTLDIMLHVHVNVVFSCFSHLICEGAVSCLQYTYNSVGRRVLSVEVKVLFLTCFGNIFIDIRLEMNCEQSERKKREKNKKIIGSASV